MDLLQELQNLKNQIFKLLFQDQQKDQVDNYISKIMKMKMWTKVSLLKNLFLGNIHEKINNFLKIKILTKIF